MEEGKQKKYQYKLKKKCKIPLKERMQHNNGGSRDQASRQGCTVTLSGHDTHTDKTQTDSLDEAARVGIARDHDWRWKEGPGGGSKKNIREALIQSSNPENRVMPA